MSLRDQLRTLRRLRPAVVALSLLAVASLARAAQVTTQFTVQITVAASCAIVSAPTLDFGSQVIFSSNIDQTSDIQIQCTNTLPYTIGLDPGTGSGATVGSRLMTNGSNTISYSLYSDSSRTLVWGQTIGTDTVSATGNGSAQDFTVYGRVFAQPTPAAGTYADTITVTVTY